MDLHLRGFKRILLFYKTRKAWISSTTTFNKDGELRGTTSKTVRSSTNLMWAPQLWTRSLTITANNTEPYFVPWGMPPFRYKGAETGAPTGVTWVLLALCILWCLLIRRWGKNAAIYEWVASQIWTKPYFYSFKIFPRFWLAKSTRLIHQNHYW